MRGATGIVGVVAWASGETNGPLIDAWRSEGVQTELLTPPDARGLLRPGDVALARLDVLRTLDGVEDGLLELAVLERRGVRVLNSPGALLAAHDKLRTAHQLDRAGIPHPLTLHVATVDELLALRPPFVVKPRFGSWGRDVMRCDGVLDRQRCAAVVRSRPWFRRHGALVQQLLPSVREDVRLLVANGEVVGGARRRAAAGEWRTNVSLGGTLAPLAVPPPEAAELAVAAGSAIGADFMGVDLLMGPHGYVVLEVNGAVDFDARYSLAGSDVHAEAARALDLVEFAAGSAGAA